MFTIPYPSPPEYQAYKVKAHRLRAAAVAGAFRDLARWVSAAAR